MSDLFEIVGVKPELAEQQVQKKENRWYDTIPWLSVIILILIVGGCLFCNRIMTKDPSYMDLKNYTIAPCKEFLFGTDTMGRDIFSMIWYGGRQSLFIGIAATVISAGIAIVFGTVSGMAPDWLDMLLMRATEILLSIPNLLTVIFLQAILGKANVWSYTRVRTPTLVNIFLAFNLFFKKRCETSRLPLCHRCLWVYSLFIFSMGSAKKIASSHTPTLIFSRYFIWNVIWVSSQMVSVLYSWDLSTADLRKAEKAPERV